ncbi:MAG: 2-oxo acid dehydrogenase subunit E2 [Phycisphaerales bacterium]|nr:2-oxo acid dehydrogenase subunit E2 [Phycisphaerales bacterium]
MPRLSDTMEQGTLVKWHVKEGQQVESGQVLADIETDKATMEMPTYDAGKVARIVCETGSNVAVGETVMILAEEGESIEEAIKSVGAEASEGESGAGAEHAAESKSKAPAAAKPAQAAGSAAAAAAAPSPGAGTSNGAGSASGASGANGAAGRMLVSPLARRIAEENGLDLKSIKGSGPQGRIIKRDVLAALGQSDETGESETAAAPAAPGAAAAPVSMPAAPLGGKVALSNMRQTIARRLVESKNTIPHYQVSVSVNADPLLDLRGTLNEQLKSQNVKLSVNDFLVRACALAIHQHPHFNAAWKGDSLQIGERINIGVAVALPEERGGGLVVATLRDADRKGLRQISAETRALADKARGKGLSLEEMSDSTFTISNLGMYEVDFFTAIINPPNAAILAVGAAMKKPVVRNDELAVGHEMSCTLSCDHRIIDGASGARFLQTLKQLLENPATLLV